MFRQKPPKKTLVMSLSLTKIKFLMREKKWHKVIECLLLHLSFSTILDVKVSLLQFSCKITLNHCKFTSTPRQRRSFSRGPTTCFRTCPGGFLYDEGRTTGHHRGSPLDPWLTNDIMITATMHGTPSFCEQADRQTRLKAFPSHRSVKYCLTYLRKRRDATEEPGEGEHDLAVLVGVVHGERVEDREVAVQAYRHEDERREIQAKRSENTQENTPSKLNVFQRKNVRPNDLKIHRKFYVNTFSVKTLENVKIHRFEYNVFQRKKVWMSQT